jgi:hypothetical protein
VALMVCVGDATGPNGPTDAALTFDEHRLVVERLVGLAKIKGLNANPITFISLRAPNC